MTRYKRSNEQRKGRVHREKNMCEKRSSIINHKDDYVKIR